MDLCAEHRTLLLDAARAAIRCALRGDCRPPAPDGLHPALLQPAGCFVTLHELRTHRLRGCVGHLQSSDPLYGTVLAAAAAVLDDPRFAQHRVTLDELPQLQLEISVLSPLEPAADPLDFDPLEHGVLLTFGQRAGCFLPQVARETGWTRQQLLDRLCTEKMSLPTGLWQSPHARLHRFTVLILGPEPFVV